MTQMKILVLLTVLCSALALPGAADTSERWPPGKWRAELSRERFTSVTQTTHYITAADGTQLSLTVHLPVGLPAEERIPTLLQLTPYTNSGDANNVFFVRRGAAYVQADARGTDGSEGCLDFGGSADQSDARVIAAWIRTQPWSNGRIVADGISHPGMGSVVAHAAVPGLTGALAHAPVVSYYQDEWLQGAKFEDQLNGPLYQATELEPPSPVEQLEDLEAVKAQAAACTGKTALDFTPIDGPFSPLWADRDLSRNITTGDAPILLTHGFADMNVHPDHSQMYWDALPDDAPKHAIFGWWYHGWPDMRRHPFRPFADIRHRWMDRLLFGQSNGLEFEPRVLVQDSLAQWHEGHDWPLEQSEAVVLRPAADGSLASATPPDGTMAYTDAAGAERKNWTGAHVVFRTEPLKADRLINGAPELDLVASSNVDQTKWVAYLFAESPQGQRQRVTHGYADSHTWDGESSWTAMTPGMKYRWTLKLQPTAVVVPAGHRLALVVASQDSRRVADPRSNLCMDDYRGGCYNPSGIAPSATVGRAVNTVQVGAQGSALRLHWVDPALTAKPPW